MEPEIRKLEHGTRNLKPRTPNQLFNY